MHLCRSLRLLHTAHRGRGHSASHWNSSEREGRRSQHHGADTHALADAERHTRVPLHARHRGRRKERRRCFVPDSRRVWRSRLRHLAGPRMRRRGVQHHKHHASHGVLGMDRQDTRSEIAQRQDGMHRHAREGSPSPSQTRKDGANLSKPAELHRWGMLQPADTVSAYLPFVGMNCMQQRLGPPRHEGSGVHSPRPAKRREEHRRMATGQTGRGGRGGQEARRKQNHDTG